MTKPTFTRQRNLHAHEFNMQPRLNSHQTSPILAAIRKPSCTRTVANNNVNAESSRSHCVVTLTVVLRRTVDGVGESLVETSRGKVVLVDLAGSERLSKTGLHLASTSTHGSGAGSGAGSVVGSVDTDKRLDEATSINKSLSALSLVIATLATPSSKRGGHVPYV